MSGPRHRPIWLVCALALAVPAAWHGFVVARDGLTFTPGLICLLTGMGAVFCFLAASQQPR